uniref:Peptidase S1 domain-containing protein n=3 Tax=Dendroctonus ponderosae TaxID=77166 RepID=A0AAR5Q8T2_DENPD
MKFAVFAFVCLLSTFVSAEEVEELGYDWDNIKSLDIFVEPIGPAEYVPPQAGLRIIGGNVAARNAFPYQAALIINNSGFCGGSIISNQWVLTAAHCVDTASSVQLILGAHNPSTTVNEPTQVRVVANARVVHTGWNGNTMQNDIALLRAASIPVGSSGISSVSLAPASSGTFAGSTAVLSGWGRTSDASNSIAAELRTVQLPIITNAVCANSYGTIITNQIICTSGAGNRGACNGDSGGPLVVSGVEVGVVSFGSRLCAAGNPTAYARVSAFRAWITSNSGV